MRNGVVEFISNFEVVHITGSPRILVLDFSSLSWIGYGNWKFEVMMQSKIVKIARLTLSIYLLSQTFTYIDSL